MLKRNLRWMIKYIRTGYDLELYVFLVVPALYFGNGTYRVLEEEGGNPVSNYHFRQFRVYGPTHRSK
jgi:hypothetical protein